MSRIATISSIIKTHLNSPAPMWSRIHRYLVNSLCVSRAETSMTIFSPFREIIIAFLYWCVRSRGKNNCIHITLHINERVWSCNLIFNHFLPIAMCLPTWECLIMQRHRRYKLWTRVIAIYCDCRERFVGCWECSIDLRWVLNFSKQLDFS